MDPSIYQAATKYLQVRGIPLSEINKEMSGKKSKWQLTKDGVYALYEKNLKEEIKLQVIFKAVLEAVWCLRLSDGLRVSPIVYINAKRVSDTFNVGAVITIKERIVTPSDYCLSDDNRLEDLGFPNVYIKFYRVDGSTDTVGKVVGLPNRGVSYRDELKHIFPALLNWDRDDDQLRYELEDSKQYNRLQQRGEYLREEGNRHFNNRQYGEALLYYDMVVKQDKYDCRVWANISQAHFKLENFTEAVVHAISSIKMNPFYGKAYFRASQAAIKDRRPLAAHQYAVDGIFLCGETKELRQILNDANSMKEEVFGALGCLEASIAHSVSSCLTHVEIVEKVHSSHTKGRVIFKEVQEILQKKKVADLRNAFGREPRKEKKIQKKPKKPSDEAASASTAAATPTSTAKEPEKAKEEDKKHAVEHKKAEKNNNQTKISLNEALQEAKRLFQSQQFQKATDMYNKCLTYTELTGTNSSSVTLKKGDRYEVQVIHFIVGMCKVQSKDRCLYEGLNVMETLCNDATKFPHKTAARYWVAVSFEKICFYKLAQKHAQMCKDSLKKLVKPIKWPGTDQPIHDTRRDVLENACKLLLEKLNSARPAPMTKCRHKNCITTQGFPYAKLEIYLNDPDFKGYLDVMCEEDCKVSYHPCCWKAYKEQDGGFNRMSDKDFLGHPCVTPDCSGKIFSIKIYDDMGELKNEVLKDKKERKNQPAPVKQKKKKADKKKEKNQTQKKRNRIESVCEDHAAGEETERRGSETTGGQNGTKTTTTTSNSNTTNNNNNSIKKTQPPPVLPIDPESLETSQVTILKPGGESQPTTPAKAAKKNKKKKTKKTITQPNLLVDPLEADLCIQNEYMARLRALQQQRDALEGEGRISVNFPLSLTSGADKPFLLLDPDNPFYLPQHLRDNPQELEDMLQNKLSTSSPPGLQKETVNTLLDFMYDWLKSEGPMHTSDPRLAEQVTESFPPEARDYVNRCGSITVFLMQSMKFAMLDDVICVHDDVVKAQKILCKEVTDKMNRSKYLIHYSDGRKAKHFSHLLDDAKSTCSTASSSVVDSLCRARSASICDNNAATVTADTDMGSNTSLAPLSKTIAEQFTTFSETNLSLNPTAAPFVPDTVNSAEKEEDEEEEEEERLEAEGGALVKWSNVDCDIVQDLAAEARENGPAKPDEEELEEEEEEDELNKEEEKEEEELNKEEEEEEVEDEVEDDNQGDEDEVKKEDEENSQEDEEDDEEGEEEPESEQEDEDMEQYITELQNEKESLKQDIENAQDQNQKLNDKLVQVKSQYKSEVMKLNQQIDELKQRNKELSTEKHNILSQRDSDTRKYKSDLSRYNEDLKNLNSRMQSAEVKCECFLDQKNELEAKLAEEVELNSQLKEELEKMKNLQESLTSCSRRAREAEVKYLSTKKELVEASMSRIINRLKEEAKVMKQLLSGMTDTTSPERAALTRTIMAWEETVAGLLEQQRTFNEEGTRLLGMIHQGRPLSALPHGDLSIPIIPTLTIAPLLNFFQANQHLTNNTKTSLPLSSPKGPTLVVSEPNPGRSPNPSPAPQPPPSPKRVLSPAPPLTEPPPVPPHIPIPLLQQGHLNGHPVFTHNGGPPPPYPPGLNVPPPSIPSSASGAIPKATAMHLPPPPKAPAVSEQVNQAPRNDGPNSLFVGQLPWEYNEASLKELFSRFGEVVSAIIYDKHCRPDGTPVPKYGFVTFRKSEDCIKALKARPIYVGNHMLNIEEKEVKRSIKPPRLPTPIGGGAGVGGGGLTGKINEGEAVNGTNNGRINFPVSGTAENAQPGAGLHHHHTLPLPTPTLHHHLQEPPPPTQPITKPKFQKLLPSNNTVGSINTLPPKLVRPQPKTVPNASKIGSQATTTKEENVTPPTSSSYSKLIEVCKQKFGKEFSSPEICTALREVRTQNNHSLMGLTTDKIVERVKQRLQARKANSGGTSSVAPWASLTQGARSKASPEWQGPGNEEAVKEESCSICLETLTGPTLALQCHHTFHEGCIRDWLRRQSNCPNCRTFALASEDYPSLTQK